MHIAFQNIRCHPTLSKCHLNAEPNYISLKVFHNQSISILAFSAIQILLEIYVLIHRYIFPLPSLPFMVLLSIARKRTE